MSRDGLMPRARRARSTRARARPIFIIGACGVVFALLAALVPLAEIVKLVNIGTLFAFIVVNVGVIILRRTKPDLERGYRVPFVPVVPDHRDPALRLPDARPDRSRRGCGSSSGWRSASSSTSSTAAATRGCARARSSTRRPSSRANAPAVSARVARARCPGVLRGGGSRCRGPCRRRAAWRSGSSRRRSPRRPTAVDRPTGSTTARFVTSGPRAYEVGTEAGRYPAMGFHTRGEMGGVWTPPIKLARRHLVRGSASSWIGPATRFTSGYGHVRCACPAAAGCASSAPTSCPARRRGVLVGLRFAGQRAGADGQAAHADATPS